MTGENTAQATSQPPKPSDVPTPAPALKRLEALVGEWTTERRHPYSPPNGRSRFEWLKKGDKGGFLVQHDEVAHPDFPNSITIIGLDTSNEAAPDAFTRHYFASRGVERVYAMSLSNGVWKLWRDAPGFSQRFTGTFSADGYTITVRLEKSSDGVKWEHDFDLIYTKQR